MCWTAISQPPRGKSVRRLATFTAKAFGHCEPVSSDSHTSVECKAEGSQHISYVFSGEWSGPEGLMPPDDVLKNWDVRKIIWRR
ncbi:lipoprotein [Salmonella enterica subsp. enterica]|uniref:Lipoprotein n=1 Tax=Salmonella enterica I TaxID=59201 RepID=A0A379WP38_SALET|nr:lipoprotein [Salmonella enterica subsp. enterica]